MKYILCLVPFLFLGCATAAPEFTLPRLITEISSHIGAPVGYEEPPRGHAHAADLEALVWVANQHGVRVEYSKELDLFDRWGVFTQRIQHPATIYLNTSLDTDGRVVVLAHELAHAFTPLLRPPDDDIVAEGVAYLVCGRLGLDVAPGTIYYYSFIDHGLDRARSDIMHNGAEITRVSEFVLAEIARAKRAKPSPRPGKTAER